jgi:hypothetical protein
MCVLCRNSALATDYLVFNSRDVVLLVENLMGNSIHTLQRPREDIYNALLMAPVTGGNSMNQKEISSSEYTRRSMLIKQLISSASAEEILKELNKLRQKR